MFQKGDVPSDPMRRFIPERCAETEQSQLAQFGRKRPGLHSLKCALSKGEEHEAEEIELRIRQIRTKHIRENPPSLKRRVETELK